MLHPPTAPNTAGSQLNLLDCVGCPTSRGLPALIFYSVRPRAVPTSGKVLPTRPRRTSAIKRYSPWGIGKTLPYLRLRCDSRPSCWPLSLAFLLLCLFAEMAQNMLFV